MPTAPAFALLTGTVTWSDLTLFDGYVLLGLVLPSNSDGIWPSVSVNGGNVPPIRLPIWTQVPIAAGVFDQNSKIYFNSAITPDSTQYVAYWYDLNKRRISPATGSNPTPFTVNTGAYAIAIPTLTVPANSGVIPTPSDNPTLGV